ncbi:hypothetical protein KEM54_002085, partial [Ascosphaera aggregata]
LTENIKAVVQGLTDRFVTRGWRNVKGLHIKGPNTMSLPIWLASELWLDEADVIEQKRIENGRSQDALNPAHKKKQDKKRKSISDGGSDADEPKSTAKKVKKVEDDSEADLNAKRKANLEKQKAKMLADTEEKQMIKSLKSA